MILSETSQTIVKQLREGNLGRELNPEEALTILGIAQRICIDDASDEEMMNYAVYVLLDLGNRVAAEVAELKARNEIVAAMNGNRATRRKRA